MEQLCNDIIFWFSNVRTIVRDYINKAKNDEGVLYWTRDKGYLVKYRYGQVNGAIFEYPKVIKMWEPDVNKATG